MDRLQLYCRHVSHCPSLPDVLYPAVGQSHAVLPRHVAGSVPPPGQHGNTLNTAAAHLTCAR